MNLVLKLYLVLLLFFGSADSIFSQTKAIKRTLGNKNLSYIANNPVPKIVLSKNGEFVAYTSATSSHGISTTLESKTGNFKREFTDVGNSAFTSNGEYFIYTDRDQLHVLNLASKSELQIMNVSIFYTALENTILYKDNGSKFLYLLNLTTNQKFKFPSSDVLTFNEAGTALALNLQDEIAFCNLNSMEIKIIFKQKDVKIKELSFNRKGDRLAFCTSDSTGSKIWYYVDSTSKLKLIEASDLLKDSKIINAQFKWAQNDFCILLEASLQKNELEGAVDVISKQVDVWNYRDEFLQSMQLDRLHESKLKGEDQNFAVNTNNYEIIKLENTLRKIAGQTTPKNFQVVTSIVNNVESYWNTKSQRKYSLINILLGDSLTIIKDAPAFLDAPVVSAGEKFAIWIDPQTKNYFTYEIETGKTTNITSKISGKFAKTAGIPEIDKGGFGYALPIWTTTDHDVLICDEFDIWQIDPKGVRKAINLTAGYGRSSRTKFRIINFENKRVDFANSDQLFVVGFEADTKRNGFWKIQLGTENLKALSPMENCLFYFPRLSGTLPGLSEYMPLKASNADVFIVRREAANSYPNFLISNGLTSFRRITDFQPQEQYNWLTSELVTWNLHGSSKCQGILYKPENFDPNLKYPIIFHYYELNSDLLNRYILPGLSKGAIDIAWYVSNGYLVFIPDIKRHGNNPGKNALDCVVSSARHLSKFKWVNVKKMGLQGQSYGGYQTNYIITHSKIFAAANTSAGKVDLIGAFGQLCFGFSSIFQGVSGQYITEVGQTALGSTPWSAPNVYKRNSPIFYANKVTTPVLILQNKQDNAVPFFQGVSFFTALRRLNKPAWLLQYDRAYHVLTSDEDRLDYTIRQQQFFDHYLKDKPAPLWMVEGIPAKYKGIKSGLQLDSLNRTP